MEDFKLRSLLKTISWRLAATLTTTILVYIFTGKAALSLGIGSLEAISKMVLYYFHERLWENISWGKHPLTRIRLNKNNLTEQDLRIISEKLRELGYL